MPGSAHAIGGPDDRERLTLDRREVLVPESLRSEAVDPHATLGVLAASRVGQGLGGPHRAGAATHALEQSIGDAPRASGLTEGFEADQNGSATELTIRGRDALASLHDAFVRADAAFTDHTHLELVTTALREVGLAERSVVSSNSANRQIMTGVPVVELGPPMTVAEILEDGAFLSARAGARPRFSSRDRGQLGRASRPDHEALKPSPMS
jgi:hypothetical protein